MKNLIDIVKENTGNIVGTIIGDKARVVYRGSDGKRHIEYNDVKAMRSSGRQKKLYDLWRNHAEILETELIEIWSGRNIYPSPLQTFFDYNQKITEERYGKEKIRKGIPVNKGGIC
ncbi:MAG: hypothetical protein WDZ77_00015 [Candidatus Pacearchaeota archaeon]